MKLEDNFENQLKSNVYVDLLWSFCLLVVIKLHEWEGFFFLLLLVAVSLGSVG